MSVIFLRFYMQWQSVENLCSAVADPSFPTFLSIFYYPYKSVLFRLVVFAWSSLLKWFLKTFGPVPFNHSNTKNAHLIDLMEVTDPQPRRLFLCCSPKLVLYALFSMFLNFVSFVSDNDLNAMLHLFVS